MSYFYQKGVYMANIFTNIFSKFSKFFTASKNKEDSSDSSQSHTQSHEQFAQDDDYIEQEEIYIQNIKEIIEDIKAIHREAGQFFEQLLNEQIEKYGAKAVSRGLDQFSIEELDSMAVVMHYRPDSSAATEAYIKLMTAITSEAPTTEDIQHMQDMVYNDTWTDYTGD